MSMRYNFIQRTLVGLLFVGSALTGAAQSSGDGYNPDNPAEPSNPDALLLYRVVVDLDTPGAATVTGGCKKQPGTTTTIKQTQTSTQSQTYKFLHWDRSTYNGATQTYELAEANCKTATSFSYTTGSEHVKFTAIYETARNVTAAASVTGAGSVTVKRGSTTTSKFFAGDVVTLTATETDASIFVFDHWELNGTPFASGTTKTATYTVTAEDAADLAFTAVYVRPPYNPTNPAEPTDAEKAARYRVDVDLSPAEAGFVTGAGKYQYGTTATVSTSPSAGYEFRHWNLSKYDPSTETYVLTTESVNTNRNFSYTVTNEDVLFTAVYEWVGIPPTDHALYLKADPVGSCTFNRESGAEVGIDNTYSVTATPGMDFTFVGWYIDGVKQPEKSLTFSSYMGTEDVTLTAKFEYTPLSPEEPGEMPETPDESEGLVGDVDGNGEVNTTDAVIIISNYLDGTTDTLKSHNADVDQNGEINTTDAVVIINNYLNGN